MEQLVRVRETHGDGTAAVIHVRESACSGDCHKCSGCGAAREAVLLTADNPIGARRGDLVKVESATAPVLKAAAVLYVLPQERLWLHSLTALLLVAVIAACVFTLAPKPNVRISGWDEQARDRHILSRP